MHLKKRLNWEAAEMLKITTHLSKPQSCDTPVSPSFQLEGTWDWVMEEPILQTASVNCLELLNILSFADTKKGQDHPKQVAKAKGERN